MIVLFVHGWSVTDTSTYGRLPEALSAQASNYDLDIDIQHIWLGRYISFHDEVTLTDIARAFQQALEDQIFSTQPEAQFSCITHSTGGPVIREWLDRFYGAARLSESPLRHLVMLAPANHGSPLAALGKARAGRIKAWFNGIEPGQRVLDWLSLGSKEQIELASSYLEYKPAEADFYPFVLTGQTIDKKFYDFVNSYLVEAGSDGVVRVASASMNYSMIQLRESSDIERHQHGEDERGFHMLEVEGELKKPHHVPLGVIPGASHSGTDKGIMASVRSLGSNKQQVEEILKCLSVQNMSDYRDRGKELASLTRSSQKRSHRYISLVFIIQDDQGDPVLDYDLFLLGSMAKDPDKLTKGFFVDRQRNAASPNHLVYYVDYDEVTKNKLTGFRIIARPESGFAYYHSVEYSSEEVDLNSIIEPNETLYIQVTLKRCVDENTFRLDKTEDYGLRKERPKGRILKRETRNSFKDEEPSGTEIKR